MNFIDFCIKYELIFVSGVIIYFIIFGIFNIKYSIRSKGDPEKIHHPEYFKNEIIVGVGCFLIAVLYPFIFNNYIDPMVLGISFKSARSQIYFHIWNNLTINLFAWGILTIIFKWNDKRKNRSISYDEWTERIRKEYKDNNFNNFKRKLLHLVPAIFILGVYSIELPTSQFMFLVITIAFHFLFVFIIFDLLRLNKNTFSRLGKFARTWGENSIIPSELNTFVSSTPMIIGFVPFIFIPPTPNILITICLTTTISDAMASIIGKKFGKIRSKKEGAKKTAEGYIAGSVTAYLLVIFVHSIWKFGELDWMEVNMMAIFVGLAIFIVDKFLSENISDNFLNPIACGMVIYLFYAIFTL